LCLYDFEDSFLAWAEFSEKSDLVPIGDHHHLPMTDLARLLRNSRAPLTAAAAAQLGLPPGAPISTAAADLLHATIDPAGPRCRSFRSASYYLCGRSRLNTETDLPTDLVGATRPARAPSPTDQEHL
jgi:hypothetical protein